ncbi:tetratricopeptide repeat protein [Streptomyces sp. INA 01156]
MGAEHPDTLRCRHNLAFNLSRLGRLEDSYSMACEVAAARARVLGPDHPDTLVTRYEVAYTLGQLGRWRRPWRPTARSPGPARGSSDRTTRHARRPLRDRHRPGPRPHRTGPRSLPRPGRRPHPGPGPRPPRDAARPARSGRQPRPARPLGGGPRRVPRGVRPA